MSLKPTWAVPEAGFDATKNEHVLEMYKTEADGSRASLEPKTQAAPSLDARIQNKLQDFSSQLGREPTEDEKLWITRIETRCSGWLEGLRADVTGKDTVPVSFLNRLVDEQEQMILYFFGELLGLKAANARDGRDFGHGNLNGNADELKAARDSAEDLQKRVDQFGVWLEENKSDLEQVDLLKLQLKEQDEHLDKLEQAHKTTSSERDAAHEVAEELTKQTEQQMCQLDEKDQLLKRYEKIMNSIIEDFKEFMDDYDLIPKQDKAPMHTAQTEHEELEDNHARLEDKYDTALSEANDAKNSVIARAERRFEARSGKEDQLSDELQKDVENHFQSSLDLREQVENLKLENAMLKRGEAPPDKSKGSIADLEAEINKLTKALKEKDEEIGDLEDALECQQEATATADSHSYAAYDDMHAADIERKFAEEQLKGVRKELEKLKAKKEEAEKLQAECTELRRSKDLLLEEKRTKATELAAASVEAKKVRIHNDAVIAEATRLNQNVLKHLQKAKEMALALQKQMHEDDSDFET